MPKTPKNKRDMGFVGHSKPCQSYKYMEKTIPAKCRPERAKSFFSDKEYMPPLVVNIEPSNACNLRCVMCPTYLYKKEATFLSWELYEKIVAETLLFQQYFESGNHGIPYFVFQGAGEPMLHKELFPMIAYAKQQGIRNISITSNGSLLNENNINYIVSEKTSPDYIIFSIDGYTKKLYEDFRRGSSFESVYNGIKSLFKRRKEGDNHEHPEIAINTLLTNSFDIEKFLEVWGAYVDNVFISPMLNLADKRKTGKLFLESVQNVSKSYISCPKIYESISITAEGFITSCQHDFGRLHVKGDMSKGDTLHSCWQNKSYRDHRMAHLTFKGNDTSCNGCDHMYRIENEQELFQTRKIVSEYYQQNGSPDNTQHS